MRLAVLVVLAGCADGIDPEWQLAHDRIVAVRADPPRVPAGGMATLDVLVGHKAGPTTEQPPDAVTVISPKNLASAVAPDGTITAPADLTGAPVPLVIGVLAGGFAATTTVWLGDSGENPMLTGLTVDGHAPDAELVVGKDVDVPLAVDADPDTDIITWLTSCGTMHDFDLPHAYLHVLPTDPQDGELAVVVRKPDGGVAWHTWPIHAQ